MLPMLPWPQDAIIEQVDQELRGGRGIISGKADVVIGKADVVIAPPFNIPKRKLMICLPHADATSTRQGTGILVAQQAHLNRSTNNNQEAHNIATARACRQTLLAILKTKHQ